MHLMILNTKQRLIRDILLFRGTFNHSPASPREIFIEALRYHAASIVLVHNHPSGGSYPQCGGSGGRPSGFRRRALCWESGFWIM